MRDFTFNTTPSIRCAANASARMGDYLRDMPSCRENRDVLFVTDAQIRSLGLADAALGSLREAGFEVTVFDRVEADPKATTVEEATSVARAVGAGCVIGFGGGSAMDVAKVVALVARSGTDLDELYGVDRATGPRLPLVLTPTTAGTGSEVTAVSILTTGAKEKKGIVSPIILPDIAVLDPVLTLGLPPAITAATGVDAMVHAIEAYTSVSANNNPVSRVLALKALELLSANIREVVQHGDNLQARGDMLLGAMLAGQAFANSPVAAVHALAYPVGSLFGVPHGLSNALVLAEVMRFNAPVCAAQYAELAPHVFPDINAGRGSQAVAAELIDRLGALNLEVGLHPGLRHVGIAEDDLDKLATDAMNQTRLLVNNPRDLGFDDARRIYAASL